MMHRILIVVFAVFLVCVACSNDSTIDTGRTQSPWLLVDNFESGLDSWTKVDAENNTDPYVDNPQVSEIRTEEKTGNRYMLRKPAAEGVVGNRKAMIFRPLPVAVEVGETFTFYTRVNVEYFPNNHSFGLANVAAADISSQGYESFEPMIRVTDKIESNGYKNNGALQILGGGETRYSYIIDPATGESANPMQTDEWYEVWYVVNNAPRDEGGQRYDLYIRGGEFETQQLVFENAEFRIGRTMPLMFFMAICNTGPQDAPYGNGGVRYDDIYMARERELSSPL